MESIALDWAACAAVLVIEYHFSMEQAWNTTHREFCLIADVKSKARGLERRSTNYDVERLTGLEAHLKNLGVLT
jgi:hypothetical protein